MFILAFLVAGLRLDADLKNLDEDLKNRPVAKVVKLLKDMQSQLQKEGEADQAVYDKLACWCETNNKEKTAALTVAQNRITDLQSVIEESASKSSRLNTEIKQLDQEIAQNEEALNKATAIRQKEAAEFNGEEKDMIQSIQALKNAVVVLSKHHEMPAEALVNIASLLRHHLHSGDSLLQATMSPSQKDTITAFVQQPAGYQSYAPASGQIFGILKQMKETFETNLSASQKEELASAQAFSELKSAKQEEIAAAKKQAQNKAVELANTDERLAQAKEDLEDTRNALSADQKFLLDLQERCNNSDKEWAERSKSRSEEIAAVGEAISILTDDDAHDLFSSTLGFTQVKTVRLTQVKSQRRQAVSMLSAAAKKSGNAELAALAVAAGLDAFVKVQKAIDDMVTALTQEKADEIKHRDFCTDELNQNEKSNMIQTDEKGDLEANMEDLKAQLDTLKEELSQLNAEIAEMNVQTKRASEDREAENHEFQQTVSDQRATQQILQKALDRLKAFYDKKSLLQQEPGAAAPPPPPSFSEHKKNAGAGGVMTMIGNVIHDAKTMESEAIKAEQDSQAAYESFVKNTNDSIGANQKEIVNKTESKARAESALTQAEADHAATLTDLENLAKYAAELHKSCDFVLNNFEVRQQARDQEVEALRQAKAVLSGADFA